MKKLFLWMVGAFTSFALTVIFVPTASAAMLDDFESGLQGGSTVDGAESDGWAFYYDEGDNGSISIDSSQGANGTSSSLKVNVTEGELYLYYLVANRGVALPAAQGANRMRFFIKFDENFSANNQEWPWHQLELGTFMSDDSTGLHYYHFFNNKGGDDWQEVILPNNPSLQRDINGVDAPYIEDYYDRFERFYFQSTPENSNMAEPVKPYTVWIDQVEFYYEDEQDACTAAGQYEFNGLTCPQDYVCTGALVDGCCIQGGCVTERLNGEEGEGEGEEGEIEVYPFDDTQGHWAEEYILELYERDIVQGRSERIFDPNGLINRAEIVKIITLLFDIDVLANEDLTENPCPDVDMDEWYAPYFQAAIDNGIVEGYPDGTCGPAKDVNRAEATKMFLEAAGAMDEVPENSSDWAALFGLDEVPFWDMEDDTWYTPYILVGYDAGVITGYNDESVRPGDPMTRAEVSKVALISHDEAVNYVFEANTECETDDDCNDGEICAEDNLCIEGIEGTVCETDDDCEDLQICSDESLCIDVECTLDEHCAEGQQCLNYECEGEIEVLQCVENTDCRIGWYCAEDSQCLPECRSDGDCPIGQGCSFLGCVVIDADNPEDIEAECNINGIQCPDGEICSGYVCVDPINDPDYECALDSDCGDGEVCNYNLCAPEEETQDEIPEDGNFNAINYKFEMSIGEYGQDEGQFYKPRAVAIDNTNNWIYVADADDEDCTQGGNNPENCPNSRIQKFDMDGNFLLSWGEWGTNAGQFDSPQGIAVDSAGNVYVADRDNNRIQKFNSNGSYILSFGQVELSQPRNVHVDINDNVYVASSENHKVIKYNSDGSNPVEIVGDFDRPTGVSTDADLNVYVADANANKILIISPTGTLIDELEVNFDNSYNVTVDPNGNIWVVDEWSHRVRKFDYSSVSTFIEMTSIEDLLFPHGVAVADNGDIYITNEGASEINVYNPQI